MSARVLYVCVALVLGARCTAARGDRRAQGEQGVAAPRPSAVEADLDLDPEADPSADRASPPTEACGALRSGTACLPAGIARLGRDGDEQRFEERPARAARLRPFAIDLREVTRAQWSRCERANRCPSAGCDGEHRSPVACVAWSEAREFCAWRGGRLPTEAEWERASAGILPAHRTYPWGDELRDGEAPRDRTPEGLRAMGGGVAEWVEDPGDFYPPLPHVAVDGGDGGDVPDASVLPERIEGGMFVYDDPRGPLRSPWRTARGGDERLPLAQRTTTLRRFRQPGDRLPWVGFRCAYDPR